MQNMVWQGLEVKLRNIGNLLTYHTISLYSMANTSNTELSVSKDVTLPTTLENRVVYGVTVFQQGSFSVVKLYTVSTLYARNIQIPSIVAQVTLPTNIRVDSVSEIIPLVGNKIHITCTKTGSNIAVAFSQLAA